VLGFFVGDIALIEPSHRRSVTAVAIEDSELIILRRAALYDIIE
jgi:CRP-like cAMP-binding protein